MGRIEEAACKLAERAKLGQTTPSEIDEWLARTSKELDVLPIFLWIEFRRALNGSGD